MIKRYFAIKDNTITNAFQEDLKTRGTGSNMGASDILEIFSIYGQASSGSTELARSLIQFNTDDISAERTAGTLAASGSVSWHLKMYDAAHVQTTPRDFKLVVNTISSNWEEGYGIDMENYEDLTKDDIGSNWMNANGDLTSATANLTALSKTSGQANTRVLTIADIAGNSVNFSIDNSISISTATKIAFGNANSNANLFAAHITGAVNLAQAAGSLNVTASAVGASVTLTQTSTGIAGNSVADISGTSISDSVITVVDQFAGGDGNWAKVGGDYHVTQPGQIVEQTFETGFENLEVDVSDVVEQWLAGDKTNYGFGIQLSSSYEAYYTSSTGLDDGAVPINLSGAIKSYYTKKFFGRDTEFFFKRPVLEARWDDTKRDDRGNFYFSSSLAPASDNLNTIYLYNYVRGRLRDIPSIGAMVGGAGTPHTGFIYVSILSGSSDNSAPSGSALVLSHDNKYVQSNQGLAARQHVITGGWVSTGIYSASFALTGTTELTKVFDVWFSGSSATSDISASTHAPLQFNTSSIDTTVFYSSDVTENQKYVLSMPNLQDQYRYDETVKLRLYSRERNWSPNIYNVATNKAIPSTLIESASYQIKRSVDDEIVIPYGTGSAYHTGLSYDISGNYFKLDTSVLEKGYQYEIYYSIYNEDSSTYIEQPYKFKFRVSEE
jgi:hypothetical protein|tara:strand:+ start:1453 stop:3453 length:2001 start_codon:yes stop_codon:yes gene_type:complete